MTSNRKDTDHLIQDLLDQGFSVVKGKRSSHWKVRKDGRLVCTMSGTASDWRAFKNTLTQLRRAGFKDRSRA